jgi:CRP/FNR family cyclic AMP-dependent transcriptional regulator
VLFEAGDQGREMYVLLQGQVDLLDADHVVETVDPGDIFGEMALIDYSPRSLSAVVRSDSRLTPIDERRFNFLVAQTPFFALHVMGVMAQRLRRQTSA